MKQTTITSLCLFLSTWISVGLIATVSSVRRKAESHFHLVR